MNDQRMPPTGPGGDDPFERELRAILRDRAAGPTPTALHQALAGVTRRPPVSATAWRRSAGSLLVAAAAILLLAMGFSPVSSWLQAVVDVPAASPTLKAAVAVVTPSPQFPDASDPSMPPRPSGAPAITWDNGLVRLTADSMLMIDEGITYSGLVPDVEVTGDPGGATSRTLEMRWVERGYRTALNLYFHADGTDWWMEPIGGPSDARSDVAAPIGRPWSGDIRMTAEHGSLEMTNVTIDAFAQRTLAGSLMDCDPVVAPVVQPDGSIVSSDQDPIAPGQPLAGTGILLMTPAEAKALLVSRGLCHLFYYRTMAGAVMDQTQHWCAPPPGTITGMFYDSDGALRIEVRGTEPFAPADPTSAFGPGCAGETIARPSPSPVPTASPEVRTVQAAYDWSGDGIVLTAESIRLAAGRSGDPEVNDGTPTATATRRHLDPGVVEARWTWGGRPAGEMRWRVTTDGERWQVAEVAYLDVWLGDTWFRWTDVPVEGRVGEAWHGDLRLRPADAEGGPASVLMKDMVFDPGIIPADLEAPPSVSPAPDRPFVVDNGGVRLSAADLALTFRDDTLRGPDGFAGTVTASSVLYRDSLEASWTDQERRMTLQLDFRQDGQRWWVSDGWIHAARVGEGRITGVDIGAPLGSAFTGDLDLTLPLVDGGSADDRIHLTIKDLSVEPFRATVARTMADCTPVIDPATTPWRTDPTAKGQPLAKADLVGMASADAAAAVENLGHCYLFDRRLTPDPSLGVSGILETWCDAPPGDVAGLRYGKGGELHLIVVTQVPTGTPKRSQPILGFGCREGVAVPSDPPPFTPPPATNPPVVIVYEDRNVVFDTGDVRLAADAVVLKIADRTYAVQPGTYGAAPDTNAQLEVIHLPLKGDDGAVQVRMFFGSDGTSWSVQRYEVYGGGVDGDLPMSVAGVGAPLFQSVTGDLVLPKQGVPIDGQAVSLELKGAELQAFRGVTARTLRDCQPLSQITPGGENLAAPGEPLDGLGLIGAPASKAAVAMEALGYCYRFGFRPADSSDSNNWYETWCDAPPGKVKRAYLGENGEAMFEVVTDQPHEDRAQPPVGWGCLSDIAAYTSPSP